MTHLRLVLTAALVALVVAVAPSFAATSATPQKLVATVGPGFTISLKMGGKKVTKLKKGAYTITVADKSAIHNFHLKAPGLNKTTTVAFVGNKTWKVTLKPGKGTYVCDPHPTTMKGSFTVTQ